jgi:hypothetical protein
MILRLFKYDSGAAFLWVCCSQMPLFQVQIQATEKDDCVLDVKEMF